MEKLTGASFFQHPMNKLMLAGTDLPQYDPVELTLKPIKLAQAGVGPTDEQVEAVRTGVIDFCGTVHGGTALEKDIRGVDATWPVMRERFKGSPGLTQMMLDGGMNSRYFYQYLVLTGRKEYAVALESKDGYAMPVSGELKFEKVPKGDWHRMVCVEEPSHPARRQTDWRPQSLLRAAKTIFEGGVGLGPAYRLYGYPLGQLNQKIVACDSDERLLKYWPLLFSGNAIELRIGDVLEVMDDPDYVGEFDLVRLTGFLSYFPKFEDKLEIMRKAARLLKPDGVIVADLWVMGASLMRTALTQLWPIDPRDPHRLAPAENESVALGEIAQLCEGIGLPYVTVSDVCNGNPNCYTQAPASGKCVMFVAGKDADLSMLDPIPIAGSPYEIDRI